MKLPTRNAKRFVQIMVAVCLTTVLFIGPFSGFLAGPKQKADSAGAQPTVQEATQVLGPMPGPAEDSFIAAAEPGTLGSSARALGATIVVLALIWMTMVLLKRYMPHRFGPLGHKRRIQVLETVPIGDKRNLTLVRIDDEGLLLASTPNGISLLKEIRLEQAAEGTTPSGKPQGRRETPQPPANVQASPKFSDTLADEMGRTNLSNEDPLEVFGRLRRELETQTS